MTDRERWTVYPLLFLTLGIAVKDKLLDVVNVENVRGRNVVCDTLIVADKHGTEQVRISSSPEGGYVRGQNMICDTLIVADKQGAEQVQVSSDAEGGFVRTHGNENGLRVILGNTKEFGGLLFVDPGGSVHIKPGSIYAAKRPPQLDEATPADTPPPEDSQPDDAEEQTPPSPAPDEQP